MMNERNWVGLYISKRSPFQRPQFYTEKEGGSWIDWPADSPFDYDWLMFRADRIVKMGELTVHALSFGHPAAGYNKIQRWDCVSGFDILCPEPHW